MLTGWYYCTNKVNVSAYYPNVVEITMNSIIKYYNLYFRKTLLQIYLKPAYNSFVSVYNLNDVEITINEDGIISRRENPFVSRDCKNNQRMILFVKPSIYLVSRTNKGYS